MDDNCLNYNDNKCSITGYQCLLPAPCLNLCVALFGKVMAGEEKTVIDFETNHS